VNKISQRSFIVSGFLYEYPPTDDSLEKLGSGFWLRWGCLSPVLKILEKDIINIEINVKTRHI
jgi:hypothetical protein